MVNAGMQPREALREVEARLTAAGCPDADFDAGELFRLVTGQDARLADRPLTAEQAAKLEALTARRATREPLQYLCGSWPFLDFELAVGPGVLCPRADTEVVAEAAAQMLAGVQAPKVLDLCAGTGCLGLGVKRFCPEADVTCVEKSPEELTVVANCTQMLELMRLAGHSVVPADAAAELRLAAAQTTLTDHDTGAAAEYLYNLVRGAEATA